MRCHMSSVADGGFHHLPPAPARLAAVLARPKVVAAACIIALVALGWVFLALLSARGLGPLALLCRPSTGAGPVWNAADYLTVAGMWVVMVLAMMLPSAAPMIVTYAEIAETAARKGEPIVSPLLIASGYTAVWLGFAASAALVQFALTRNAPFGSALMGAPISGTFFIVAGLYQFSALKHACLAQCRAPFPFFFAHWQTTARGVFRLGLRQGLYCLGCCWAMMLLMLATGTMNAIWMAVLGMTMALEKIGGGRPLSYGLGASLIALGVSVIAMSFAAGWPLPGI